MTDLPSQLRDLAVKAADLPDALRVALQTNLLEASADATPEQVLASTFAGLGYLPGEAERAAQKLLDEPPRLPIDSPAPGA